MGVTMNLLVFRIGGSLLHCLQIKFFVLIFFIPNISPLIRSRERMNFVLIEECQNEVETRPAITQES